MTFPRYRALKKSWRENPPVHILLASIVGYRAPEEEPERSSAAPAAEQSLENLMRDFCAAGGGVR